MVCYYVETLKYGPVLKGLERWENKVVHVHPVPAGLILESEHIMSQSLSLPNAAKLVTVRRQPLQNLHPGCAQVVCCKSETLHVSWANN